MDLKCILIVLFSSTISFLGYTQKNEALQKLSTSSQTIYDICYTDKGNVLGVADGTAVKLFSSLSGELLSEFLNGHRKQIMAISISKDSSILVSGGKDSTIVIWDLITGKIVRTLNYHKGIVTSLKLSPDGEYLISGGADKKACLYNLKKNELVWECADHNSDITAVAFSQDSKLFATGGGDQWIYIYSIDQKKLIAKSQEHINWVRDIAFSKDGRKLISCGDDSRTVIRSMNQSGEITFTDIEQNLKGWILSIDVNQDNQTLAFGGLHGVIYMRGPVANYHEPLKSPICKVRFQPSTGIYLRVAVATLGKGVYIMDAKNMKNEM